MDSPVRDPGTNSERPAAWPRAAQTASVALLVLALVLMGWHLAGMQRSATRPTELVFRTDLNRADVVELQQLPGIGPTLARRIEAHRQQHGAFRKLDDLTLVGGIGATTVERVRPYVWLEPPPAEKDDDAPVLLTRKPIVDPGVRNIGTRKIDSLTEAIDINRASLGELLRLPGVGPVLSARIVQTREVRPFASVDELRRVPGIGPKTLERLRPFVTVAEPVATVQE